MPEYLAPGVYVEEVSSGPRPIEGVSTSTAAMVGLTERGPENVPIFVSSVGEYQRWFGGRLNIDDFIDPIDQDRAHGYLPYAVEGFFGNRGKRLYVTRVMPEGARRSRFVLHIQSDPNAPETQLLRSAPAGSGIVGTQLLYAVELNGLAVGDTIRVGDGSRAEYRTITALGGAATHIATDLPLSHAHDTVVSVESVGLVPIGPVMALADDAVRGDDLIVVAAGAAPAVGITVEVRAAAGGNSEFRRVLAVQPGVPGEFLLSLDSALHLNYANGDPVQEINLAGAVGLTNLDFESSGGDIAVYPAAPAGLVNALLLIDAGSDTQDVRRIGEIARLDIDPPAHADYPARSVVEHVVLADDASAPRSLTADAAAGATVISLDNRIGLAVGDVLRVGVAGVDAEFVTISGFGGIRLPPPDAGTVVVEQRLQRPHFAGDVVQGQNPPALGANTPANLVFAVDEGDVDLVATQGAGAGYAVGDVLRVRLPSGAAFFHVVGGVAALAAREITVGDAIERSHDAGAVVAQRDPLLEVEALDRGEWGNRLRISAEFYERGLVARSEVRGAPLVSQIQLASLTGVEPGTVLELLDPVTRARIGEPIKVATTDPAANNLVTLDGAGLTVAQRTAILVAIAANAPLIVHSIEFTLTVRLLQAPEPAVPSRDQRVIDTIVHEALSMDPRHSRYVERVVGDIDGDLRPSDLRPEGECPYVRVRDQAANAAAAQVIRLGPETLVDVLASGRELPARHPLSGGDNAVNSINNGIYIGADNIDPELRTGLFSLTRLPVLGLVGMPGQTHPQIQQALIDHCERDRYRFAILDGQPPGNDGLAEILAQRQQFDTTYAALYTPWLSMPDPYPENLAVVAPFMMPPSGHVMGLIARTDETRGVHKAPANEVVNGVNGLARYLNKAEQDLINPYPYNVCAIRRFANRGIRVYGARVITSDSSLKYIPVRRLLLFLEQSIEIGLQWVVFEPNAEPLWARVRQSLNGFLTGVWRDGALEGTSTEQAFFVKCDRTTMTQDDIDNGRLICLVGVAPVKPAEYVIIRIGLKTAEAQN
jgi:phage tail sheath protein FI